MSTLADIQRLVNEAWVADHERTQGYFIPEIKDALSECDDLDQKFSRVLGKLIPKLLDDKTLDSWFGHSQVGLRN